MKCSACGGTEHLRPGSPWHGDKVICNPCFMVWYETGITDAIKLGVESLRLKAVGRFPWNGRFAPKDKELET